MSPSEPTKPWKLEHRILFTLAVIGGIIFAQMRTTFISPYLHFAWQAQSFLHGRLDLAPELLNAVSTMDVTEHAGKFYWPLGPLPSILMLPFVAFVPASVLQIALETLLSLFIACAAYRLARLALLSTLDGLWMTFAFLFSSVTIGIVLIDGPWQIAHLAAMALFLAAILEWRGRNRPLLIGTLMGLAIASRLTVAVCVIFFLLQI